MRVALVNPPQLLLKSLGRGNIGKVFQPLGLAYVAACLLEKGYDTFIIDANAEGYQNVEERGDRLYFGLPMKEVIYRLERLKPDVVGISVPFSVNEEISLDLGAEMRRLEDDVILVYGGAHSTVAAERMLKVADYVVMGEGEVTTTELLGCLEKRASTDIKNVEGIAFRRNGEIVATPRREPVKCLDSIPFPARHLLPMEKYFEALRHGRGPRASYTFSERWSTMITSRGCPYRCIFCSIQSVFGHEFRARSPENVVDEMEQLTNQYDIRHINIEDDNMTLDKKRFKKICDLIVKRELDFTWSAPNGIRADTLDEELVQKMSWSGCRRVFVAPESGVQHVVTNIIGKNLNLEEVEHAVRMFVKYGIIVDGSFVMGLIGRSGSNIVVETKSEIRSTIKYALKLKKLGMKDAGFHIATPLFGTRLYELAEESGFLTENDTSKYSPFESLMKTPEWSGQDILDSLYIANWLYNSSFEGQVKQLGSLACHLRLRTLLRRIISMAQVYLTSGG